MLGSLFGEGIVLVRVWSINMLFDNYYGFWARGSLGWIAVCRVNPCEF